MRCTLRYDIGHYHSVEFHFQIFYINGKHFFKYISELKTKKKQKKKNKKKQEKKKKKKQQQKKKKTTIKTTTTKNKTKTKNK